jgi:hypothetical protein
MKIFRDRDISMIFCGHRHIIITHCLTLAKAAIRYLKIQGAQLWKGKRKRSNFFNWLYPM